MKQIIFAAACLLAAVPACGKGGGGGGASVDEASFKAMTGAIKAGDPWAKTSADVIKLMGPAKTKSDQEWTFAADDGSDCWDLQLQKDGDKVAGWGGGHVNKMVEDQYNKCAAKAKATAAP